MQSNPFIAIAARSTLTRIFKLNANQWLILFLKDICLIIKTVSKQMSDD